MSSNYSISTSESSSFCTNPTVHHTHSRSAPAAASARGTRPTEAASPVPRNDVTPKKAAQSTKAATATANQESPSMTIRRVPVDYSKRMEDQKARSSALERYKMLVKGNRLVPSDGEASPDPKKAPAAEESELSTTWRRSDLMHPSSAHRGESAASNTVLSDVSDEEEMAAATPVGQRTTGKSQPGISADPLPPRSVSRRQQQQQEPSLEAYQFPNADSEDGATAYVSPELTQPFGQTSLRPRSTIRPGYDPVTEHEGSSFTRTVSSTNGDGLPRTPRRQPGSQVRSHSSVAQDRNAASAQGPSTPRRKSTTKLRAAETVTAAAAAPPPPAVAVDAPTGTFTAEGGEGAQRTTQRTDPSVVSLPGSKTAFWMRPSSAMYEMTTSIAAKRKDHADQEIATHTSSSSTRRTSRTYHAIPTGSSSSPCGTPRGRVGAAVEERPRFSTHLSATDRKVYEDGGAAAAAVPPAVSTYDTIFSQRHSTRHSQKVGAADASVASSTPRGTPRGAPQQQQRACQRAGGVVRSPSTLSRLSSRQHSQTPKEEQGAGRVSTRQSDALSKHCARVAAGGPAATSGPAAVTKPARAGKKATTATTAAPMAATAPQLEVRKRLDYTASVASTEEADEGEAPVPLTVVPHSNNRGAATITTPSRRTADHAEERNEDSSPRTTVHGRRAGDSATPSKSRRREYDVTASPPRDDNNDNNVTGDDDARCAAQDAVMEREKAAARAQHARAALESCRLARQARAEAARTTYSAGGPAGGVPSTNEVVAAMLQGIVQQTRQVLPCYLCGELQCTSGYKVHVSACRPATEAILRDYFTTVGGLADIPAAVKANVDRLAAQEVPLSTSDVAVREAFAMECYRCVKATLVPCRKCGTQLRVQDVKEHEMLCGRTYYQNSRAAERVRSAVDRIERGSHD